MRACSGQSRTLFPRLTALSLKTMGLGMHFILAGSLAKERFVVATPQAGWGCLAGLPSVTGYHLFIRFNGSPVNDNTEGVRFVFAEVLHK